VKISNEPAKNNENQQQATHQQRPFATYHAKSMKISNKPVKNNEHQQTQLSKNNENQEHTIHNSEHGQRSMQKQFKPITNHHTNTMSISKKPFKKL